MPPRATLHSARARRGFTITEVAISVVVLAVAITTALAAMQQAFLQLDTARNLQIAGSIMQTEIEKERLFTWAQVSDATYQPAIDAAFLSKPQIAGRFTLSRTVAPVTGRSGLMVQVTLTVTWRAPNGRTLSRSYLTYFLQNGLHDYIYKNA